MNNKVLVRTGSLRFFKKYRQPFEKFWLVPVPVRETVRKKNLLMTYYLYLKHLRAFIKLKILWCSRSKQIVVLTILLEISVQPSWKYYFSFSEIGISSYHSTIRPQSVNCSVLISRPPQFRIRKSEIFGAEKWSFDNCRNVVTRAERFYSSNPW